MSFISRKLNLLKKVDFEKVCRICLSDKNSLKNIIQTRIPKMMETCASVEVSENDGLPHNICVTCYRLISKFHAFKRKIERSDKTLRQYINNKIKRSDILKEALTKANIDKNNADMKNDIDMSDEDIALSKRLTKRVRRKYPSNSSTKCENNIEIVDEPPPLVPLSIDNESGVVEQLVLSLPPLIPIHPGVNIKTLENIVPEIENSQLQCKSCDEIFTEATAFSEHKSVCTESVLQCSICKKQFTERKKLIRHLKGHTVVKDYCCKICKKFYPNASKFRVHLRSHSGERPFRCAVCNKGFIIQAGLDRHVKIHEDGKPYECDICGRSFKVDTYLERHKKLHTGVKPFRCSLCDKSFSQSEKLLEHNRTYHTNERPFLCNVCGKRFVSSPRLSRHMWMHSGFKPYACQYCPKTFSNCKNFKNHEQQHVDQSFENCSCEICGRKFSHPWRLSRHKKIHEGMFQCQLCSKPYSSENLLNKHLISKHDFIANVGDSAEFYEEFEDGQNLEEIEMCK